MINNFIPHDLALSLLGPDGQVFIHTWPTGNGD